MTQEISNAYLIRAVLDGKQIEISRNADYGEHHFSNGDIIRWLANPPIGWKFRIKFTPVVRYIAVARSNVTGHILSSRLFIDPKETHLVNDPTEKVIRLELHPDTFDVISATTHLP